MRDGRSARPGDATENEVHGIAGLVVAVRPEVAVGVECLGRGLVVEAALDGLDGAALGDHERGVEVAEVVEGGSVGQAGDWSGPVPHGAERVAAEGVALRLVKTSPYCPGRYRARWAARVEDTSSGMGTVRKPALLFGGPNSGTPRRAATTWRSTRT